jgi:hypothetical protein
VRRVEEVRTLAYCEFMRCRGLCAEERIIGDDAKADGVWPSAGGGNVPIENADHAVELTKCLTQL